ncbi:hypothetical protein [Actinomadura opuntiae]|uniref:hypothetical protein n=1 Tax=Actinomadura sp. OS1-43 TaxID=604315 RepID=UPI00255A7623|nr:hypothetical protein [Actinomadura sp. OS1-43]MDL4815909.1 hypothetical protein [Actinomadura sp. OS1-43]
MTPTRPAQPVPPTAAGPPEKIAVPVLPSAVPPQPEDRLVYPALRGEPAGRRSGGLDGVS